MDYDGEIRNLPIDQIVHWSLSAKVMIIIQHDDQLLLNMLKNFIQQNIDGALGLLPEFRGLLQVSEERVPKAGDSLLDSVCQVTQKSGRVGVCVIQLIPDERPLLLAKKVGNQRRLSRSRVSGDERHGQFQVRVQAFDQAWTRQHLGSRSRRQEFGAQKKRSRRNSS